MEDGSQSPLEKLSRTDHFEDASQSGARGAFPVAISNVASLGLARAVEFFFLVRNKTVVVVRLVVFRFTLKGLSNSKQDKLKRRVGLLVANAGQTV